MCNENDELIQELSDLWHSMLHASKYKEIEEEYKRLNELTTIEIGIIRIISQKEDVILKEICSILKIPKSTLTNAIDRLEKRNYIKRTISKNDKRSFGLQLTEEGKLLQKEHIDFEKAVYGELLNSLDTFEEKKGFLMLLRKIVSKIQ
ncbi:MarR family transcriptional regulator [Clostridium sp.]|uniref:MarR family winged helix-turn-helix transcriptional regulator n=1 Tax=Clostridium sp. TaxID=1506 RepID=UPI0026186557|nr:MarR family transcriptional regulator [Clostridium sp.]